MKITIIATHYLPHIGGLELATYHLSTEFAKNGDTVHIITPYSSDSADISPINVHRFPIHKYPDEPKLIAFLDGLLFFKKTLKTIKSIKPDIIQAQNITNSIPAYIAWKKYHIPYTICLHANLELMGPFLHRFLKKYWSKLPYIKRASKIIVLTTDMATRVENEFGKKSDIIPNGIDLNLFYPSKSRDKIKNQSPIIITLSRIDDKKGLEYAILSMPKILEKSPNAKLKIIGDGEYKLELQKIVTKHNLSNNVEFVGLIPNRDVPIYLRKADIFLIPSLSEGFSITALEAIACGLPIISTNVGIVPEIISSWKNGYIIPFKSSEAIADAVINLLSNSELHKILSINSTKAAKETLSWKNVGDKYIELYNNITNTKYLP